MLMILLSSCLLILLVIALRHYTKKKVSPIVQYSLWLLVALRLLLPFQFGASVLSLENIFKTRAEPVQVEVHTEPQISTPVEIRPSAPVTAIPNPTVDSVTVTTDSSEQITILPTEEIIREEQEITVPTPTVTVTERPAVAITPASTATQESRGSSLSPTQILTGIWIVGALAMAGWFLTVNIRFNRKAKANARKLHIPHISLPIYETEDIPSPCIAGLFRPRIFLLPGTTVQQQTHILTHEMTHYRHWDHVWSLARCLCLCVYWFNPLVWIAAHLSKEDCELACDYSAIKTLGEEERLLYGRTLLDILTKPRKSVTPLHTATTMGGTKQQLQTRIEAIRTKPKKVLRVLVSLLLVVLLAVGCTFTGGKEATQAPTEEVTETTVAAEESTAPTEEITLNATEENSDTETPTENPYAFLPYGNATVVTDYEADGYAIPKLLLDTPHGEDVNNQIQERFGKIAQGDRSQYSNLSYDWYINTLEEEFLDDHYILTLEIRVTYSRGGIEECFYYNVDLATGEEPYDMSFYSELQYHVAQTFASELMVRYRNTGDLSFTQEDLLRFRRNLDRIGEDSTAWFRKDGKVQATYLYEYMDSNYLGEVHVDDLLSGFYPAENFASQEAEVVKLYTYIDELGAENTIPFILAPGNRILNANATILLSYLERELNHVTYSWAVNGDILSFAIQSDESEYFGCLCHAWNFFLNDDDSRIPSMEEVLAQAKIPITKKEYIEKAKVAFRSYFFDLFPGITERFPDNKTVSSVVYQCGTNNNIENSTPYLDRDGNVWAMGKIYQLAGSSSNTWLIPISTGTLNKEYLTFAEESNLFLQGEQALQRYLNTLYGEGTYDLIYSAENAHPEYVDDKIHAEGLDDHVIVRISRELDPTMTEADIEAIPELKAACEMLGVDKIEYFTNTSAPDSVREMYIMNSMDVRFTGPIERFVKVVWDTTNKEVSLLIYWG